MFETIFSGKSFIYIRKSSGPRIEPWRIPASAFVHVKYWPLRITLCFLSLRKLVKVSSKSPATPFCFNLNIRALCKILSKALDISRKTPLTSNTSSKDRYISCVVEINWFVHESTSIKPDWFEEIKSLSVKYSNRLLHIKDILKAYFC